jgi:threonine/homoserine/homoserine lactone efflux protein
VAGVALGSLAWVTMLAIVVAVVRRAAGERALRTADAIAGVGLLGFGGALAYGSVRAE